MRHEISPPTSVLADDPLVRRALVASLEIALDLVDEGEAEVWVADRPAGGPPGVPSVALVDRGADPRPLLLAGWRGVLDRDGDPERIAAAVRAVHAGLQVQEPEPVGPVSAPELTPREVEVLELLAQGMSNREIGDILGISAHTAKFHVQGLLEKLDATTRTEAAVRAARLLLV